jgi:hypothetical protein
LALLLHVAAVAATLIVAAIEAMEGAGTIAVIAPVYTT